MPQRFRLEKNL